MENQNRFQKKKEQPQGQQLTPEQIKEIQQTEQLITALQNNGVFRINLLKRLEGLENTLTKLGQTIDDFAEAYLNKDEEADDDESDEAVEDQEEEVEDDEDIQLPAPKVKVKK